MKKDRGLLAYSFAVIVCLAAVVAFLAQHGRHARLYGAAGRPGEAPPLIVAVEQAEEAFTIWKGRGCRGRVVVAFSRWLNFVEVDDSRLIPPTTSFPIRVANLATLAEKQLGARNFLYLAVKSGIARELIHVVPASEFAGRSEAAAGEGVVPRRGRLEVPYMGSPRTISSLKALRVPSEPLLLYVNASFFREHEPAELLRWLQQGRVTSDCIILCGSADDPEVGPLERERLGAFKGLLEGAYGRK